VIAKSLKAQLTTISLIPMLLTLVFISVLIFHEFSKNADEKVQTRALDIAAQATEIAEFALYTEDKEALAKIAKTMSKLDGLNKVCFLDPSQNVIVEIGKTQFSSHKFNFPIYSKPFSLDDFNDENTNIAPVQLGSIMFELSSKKLAKNQANIYTSAMFITIPALLIGVLLSIALSHKLKKAINDLSVAAHSISDGQFASRCEESGTGELLELQKTFNTMAESFEENEQRLQVKVDIATSSLSNIIDDLNLKHEELVKSRQETIKLERSQAISAERERIMRDMHDGIGGQLVASLALLEKETDSELKDNISQIISDCLNDLRLIINSLSTANNSLGKLLADLKFRMNKRLERLEIKLIWRVADIAESLLLPPQKSLNLLRILQEVFTNILKHANANEIRFSLTHDENNIIIEIHDNGQFNPSNINQNGIGITNMKNRTNALDAAFSMTQNEQGGCMIRLIMDIDKIELPVIPNKNQA